MNVKFFFDNVDNSEFLSEYTLKKLEKIRRFSIQNIVIKFSIAHKEKTVTFQAGDFFLKETSHDSEDFYACTNRMIDRVYKNLLNTKNKKIELSKC